MFLRHLCLIFFNNCSDSKPINFLYCICFSSFNRLHQLCLLFKNLLLLRDFKAISAFPSGGCIKSLPAPCLSFCWFLSVSLFPLSYAVPQAYISKTKCYHYITDVTCTVHKWCVGEGTSWGEQSDG